MNERYTGRKSQWKGVCMAKSKSDRRKVKERIDEKMRELKKITRDVPDIIAEEIYSDSILELEIIMLLRNLHSGRRKMCEREREE